MTTGPRILIVRLSSLGDIVHTIPTLSALRESLPGATIDWLVDSHFEPILKEVTTLDHIIPVNQKSLSGHSGIIGTVRILRTRGYDVVIDLQGLVKSALFGRAAAGRQFLGFSHRFVREFPAAALYSRTVSPAGYGHVIQKNLRLLAGLGIAVDSIRFRWQPTSWEDSRTGKEPSYCVLLPGTPRVNKRWGAESYGQLADTLQRETGLRSIVAFGTEDERGLAMRAAASSHGSASVPDLLSLRELMHLLRGASLVVGSDSGPVHLAWAFDRPGIGIFGPTNPARNGPWTAAGRAVSRYGECKCKQRKRCILQRSCISAISVDEVMKEAMSLIGKPG